MAIWGWVGGGGELQGVMAWGGGGGGGGGGLGVMTLWGGEGGRWLGVMALLVGNFFSHFLVYCCISYCTCTFVKKEKKKKKCFYLDIGTCDMCITFLKIYYL